MQFHRSSNQCCLYGLKAADNMRLLSVISQAWLYLICSVIRGDMWTETVTPSAEALCPLQHIYSTTNMHPPKNTLPRFFLSLQFSAFQKKLLCKRDVVDCHLGYIYYNHSLLTAFLTFVRNVQSWALAIETFMRNNCLGDGGYCCRHSAAYCWCWWAAWQSPLSIQVGIDLPTIITAATALLPFFTVIVCDSLWNVTPWHFPFDWRLSFTVVVTLEPVNLSFYTRDNLNKIYFLIYIKGKVY